MFPQLVNRNLPLHSLPCHRHLLRHLFHRLLSLPTNLLPPEAIRQITTHLLHPLHPPTRHQRRLRRMLKPQEIPLLRDRNPIPRIVHHTHNIPIHIPRLHTHPLIHTPHQHITRLRQLHHRHLQRPEAPAEARLPPPHVEFPSIQLPLHLPVTVLGIVDIRQPPRPALIYRHLHSTHSPPAARIRIPLRPIRLRALD